jgi:hypothetical protein
LVALALLPCGASANTTTPPYIQWESLGVAAGAQIQSPVLSIVSCDDVEILADNSAGGSTRTINIDWLGSNGTTILFRSSITVGIASRSAAVVSRYGSNAAQGAGATALGQMPASKLQVTLAAGGAAARSLALYCR